MHLLNSEVVRSAYMGICFMILFSAVFTIANLMKLFLESTHQENPSFTGDGYVSLAVLYTTFSVFMWMVPSIISVIGPKMTLAIGSVGYSLLIGSFFTENAWLLYAASLLCGMGASMIWTSQGSYMILISSPLTLTRNMAIFNFIWESSLFYGNIFTYITFQDKDKIEKETRTTVLLVLLAVSIASNIAFLLLPSPVDSQGNKIIENHGSPLQALKKTWKIACTKHMLILFITFVYMAQIVLMGLGKKISMWKYGQTTVMLSALAIEYAAFVLVLLNFPNNSVFGVTEDSAIVQSSWWAALVAALLIGLTDGIYWSMIPTLVGVLFPKDSVYACAVFTFVHSFLSAVGFFSSNYVGLYWQLLVLTVTGTLGAMSYIYVSLDIHKNKQQTDL